MTVTITNRSNYKISLPGTHKTLGPKSTVVLTAAEFLRARPVLLRYRRLGVLAFADLAPAHDVYLPPRVVVAVESATRVEPPADPTELTKYLVPAGAAGAWSGQDHRLAVFLGGAWTFHEPFEGLCVYVKDTGLFLSFDGSVWHRADLEQQSKLAWLAALEETALINP